MKIILSFFLGSKGYHLVVAIHRRPLVLAVHHFRHRLVLPIVHHGRRRPVWRVAFLSQCSGFNLIDSLPLAAARLGRPTKVEFDVVHKVCRVGEAVVADVATRAVRQNIAHSLGIGISHQAFASVQVQYKKKVNGKNSNLVKALFVLLLLEGCHSILRTARSSVPDESKDDNDDDEGLRNLGLLSKLVALPPSLSMLDGLGGAPLASPLLSRFKGGTPLSRPLKLEGGLLLSKPRVP